MTKKWILSLIVLLIIGAFWFGYYQYNKPRESLANQDAAYTLQASEWVAAYNNDESAADTKYLGKVVEVSGTVSSVNEDNGLLTVVLEGEGMNNVQCAFAQGYQVPEPVTAGEKVTIRGRCSGFLLDVVMNDCVIIN